MKFSLSWLQTWLETQAGLNEITTTLSAIGLEVENVEDRAAGLTAFVIAQVMQADPHPNADRLRVCKVNAGGEIVSVVCGAPNARAGMKAVFAPPGAVMPGNGMVLKVGEIRGVKSEGMLVSFRELGLGDEHDGIIELPADAPVGARYAAWVKLDDKVIEIAVTPNRGDALSVRGVARDLAAAGLGRLKPFSPAVIAGEAASTITWRNEFVEACPFVLGRVVKNVANGPSPAWLQARLDSIGLRPINALVDMTNFFTIDLGRPLHVFDADKISGNVLSLRRGAGERFAGLNGKVITVSGDDCVISDAAGVQSLAGILGGEATGCDMNTKNVFIECALFDRVYIARAGQRHGIYSDARQRFERGIDSQLLRQGLDAATAMVMEICGGRPSQICEAGQKPVWNRRASLRFARLKTFGGAEILPDMAVGALERLGFRVYRRDGAQVELDVPSWRNDVAALQALEPWPGLNPEIAAAAAVGAAQAEPENDLMEEVLRLRGLDAIAAVSLPPLAMIPAPALSPAQARAGLARRVLAARCMLECVTFSFTSHKVAALFGPAPGNLRLTNPIAADLDQMRASPLATLALAAARNAARGFADLALFEVGPGYLAADSQILIAAGMRSGQTALGAMAAQRGFDAMDAKADALALLTALGVAPEAITTTADAPGYYHPGQSGILRQGPKIILATFGTLHPALCAQLDLAKGSVAFEVFLDALPEPKRRRKGAILLSALQPVRRDFAFVVAADVPAEALLRAARNAERGLVSEVVLFDRYSGKNIPEGKISLAIAVTIQPQQTPLSEAELEAIGAKIIAAVGKATRGVLRG